MNWFDRRPEHEMRPTRPAGMRPSLSEITPELLVGEYPRPDDADWLRHSHGVTAVHNLQDDDDLRLNGLNSAALKRAYQANHIVLIRTPIQDGSADAMGERLRDALEALQRLISADRRVYLHCNAGLNRAPTLAIAWLRAYRGMSLDEAMAHVKKRRACGPFMTVLEEHFGPRDVKP